MDFKVGDTIKLRGNDVEFVWHYKRHTSDLTCVGSSKSEKDFRKKAAGYGIAAFLFPTMHVHHTRALLTEKCEEDESLNEDPF